MFIWGNPLKAFNLSLPIVSLSDSDSTWLLACAADLGEQWMPKLDSLKRPNLAPQHVSISRDSNGHFNMGHVFHPVRHRAEPNLFRNLAIKHR